MPRTPRSRPAAGPGAVARRPPARIVDIELGEPYVGWHARARADFPARLLADLQTNDVARVIRALDGIILEHNFPDEHDELAASMGEVDPYDGLVLAGIAVIDALGKLPNR
jgi:hypothetical protein